MPLLRLIPFLALLSPCNLLAQENSLKESGFTLAVGFAATFLEKNDSAKLLRYTSKSKGVYALYREGEGDKSSFKHYNTLSLSNFDYSGIFVSPPVYMSLEDYCENAKDGTFADTATTYHPLSDIAAENNEISTGSIPESRLKEFLELEDLSRRVVINHKGKRMTFYLGYVMDRWVVTMIDARYCP